MIITEVLEKPDTYIIDDFLTPEETKDLQPHLNSLEWKQFADVGISNVELEKTKGYHVMEEEFGEVEKYYFSKIKSLDFDTPPRFDRVLYNSFEQGNSPIPHVDSMRMGAYTYIIYPNVEWEESWGGETSLFFIPEIVSPDPRERMPLKIYTKPGRLLIFPGNMLHSGSGTTISKSRYSMAYQFWNTDK